MLQQNGMFFFDKRTYMLACQYFTTLNITLFGGVRKCRLPMGSTRLSVLDSTNFMYFCGPFKRYGVSKKKYGIIGNHRVHPLLRRAVDVGCSAKPHRTCLFPGNTATQACSVPDQHRHAMENPL